MLSPIVLFTYNRPIHTKKTLDSLSQNPEAPESILYIYCDGPKENANQETLENIQKVRELVKQEKRFQKVIVKEQTKNKGLANSIIDGVTEVMSQHGTIIVLEDDILVEKGFLKYMNNALSMYNEEETVGCIHAWNYVLDTTDMKDTTFFLRGADCLGWATWKRSWDLFEPNANLLLQQIESRKLQFEFDRRGIYPYTQLIRAQINKKVDSWAIRWHASLFLQNKFCLQPVRSIVTNIGLDNTGTHTFIESIEMNMNNQKTIPEIILKKIPIQESDWFFEEYKKKYKIKHKKNRIQECITRIKKTIIVWKNKFKNPKSFII